jgi:hypothetical protein
MVKSMKTTLFVDRDTAEDLEMLCQKPSTDNIGRGEVLYDGEARFPDGTVMVVQVIASEEPTMETCWTQGVLFDSGGRECGCTDVGESFLGEYIIGDYTCEVVKK